MLRLVLLLVVLGIVSVSVARALDRRRRERLAQLRAAFLVGVPAPRDSDRAFKQVALRSGAVRMRLPRQWAEEYPDEGHASFRDPSSPERLLRLSSTTVEAPEGLRVLLQSGAGREATTIEELPEAQMLLRSLDASREDGRDVISFRWLRAAPLSSSRARLAAFALRVPERAAFDPLARDVIAMVDSEVRSASLAGERDSPAPTDAPPPVR